MSDWEPEERRQRGRRKRAPVLIGRTRVGKGIFAGHRFPNNAIIGEITGEILCDENYGSDYCFDLGDNRYLEPIAPFRFVNHCCEPNCEFDYFEWCEPDAAPHVRVFLLAIRDIMEGEELTIDYHWPATHAIRCRCQASTCRGWVVSEKFLSQVVEEHA